MDKADASFKISIVGLGLMGGSLAMALKGFKNAAVTGFNRSEAPLREALDSHTIHEGYVINKHTAKKALDADLVVICLYPRASIEFLEQYAAYFKPGSIVTDVVGIKSAIIEKARALLPKGVEFIGSHPMAGREISGYAAAVPTLFSSCNYIITPVADNSEAAIELIQDMAYYIGAAKVTFATPQDHDLMIAYTSQMAHVLAPAVVRSKHLIESKGFEGGSFRDLTRVATLNPDMWSELFVLNQSALCNILEELESNIAYFRKLIEGGDREQIKQALEETTKRKELWKKAAEMFTD